MTMTRQLASNLLRLAEVYRTAVPQSLTTVSKLMARDAGLLNRLATTEAGFTVGKYDETTQRFSNYWPESLAWPDGIPRPKRLETLVQKVHKRPNRTAGK